MRVKAWGSRKDDNHAEVKRWFEQLKCRVKDVSNVPNFCDLVVQRGKVVRFVEVKDPSKVPSQRKLTKGEQQFHDTWEGAVVVETFGDVVETVEGML